MNKFQAEKIINLYGGAIANNKDVFRKQSALPCSKAKIRYAFYVYITALITDLGQLPKDIGESLVITYSMLDSFVPDEDSLRLNKIPELIANKELNSNRPEDKKQIEEYFSLIPKVLHNDKYFDEINDFIVECNKEKEGMSKNKKREIFEDESRKQKKLEDPEDIRFYYVGRALQKIRQKLIKKGIRV